MVQALLETIDLSLYIAIRSISLNIWFVLPLC